MKKEIILMGYKHSDVSLFEKFKEISNLCCELDISIGIEMPSSETAEDKRSFYRNKIDSAKIDYSVSIFEKNYGIEWDKFISLVLDRNYDQDLNEMKKYFSNNTESYDSFQRLVLSWKVCYVNYTLLDYVLRAHCNYFFFDSKNHILEIQALSKNCLFKEAEIKSIERESVMEENILNQPGEKLFVITGAAHVNGLEKKLSQKALKVEVCGIEVKPDRSIFEHNDPVLVLKNLQAKKTSLIVSSPHGTFSSKKSIEQEGTMEESKTEKEEKLFKKSLA